MTNSRINESDPLVLVVPGSGKALADQRQSLWTLDHPNCQHLDLGNWDKPHRNNWINVLNLFLWQANRPVVIVAEGLACPIVAWWAEYERPNLGEPVAGALFVSPPESTVRALIPSWRAFIPAQDGLCPLTAS